MDKHNVVQAATKSKYGKISKSQILTLPHPQGHVMSVKCEQSIDGLSVQVWLLYDHPNLKYCTLNVSGTELRTDRRTDGRTNRRTDIRVCVGYIKAKFCWVFVVGYSTYVYAKGHILGRKSSNSIGLKVYMSKHCWFTIKTNSM